MRAITKYKRTSPKNMYKANINRNKSGSSFLFATSGLKGIFPFVKAVCKILAKYTNAPIPIISSIFSNRKFIVNN